LLLASLMPILAFQPRSLHSPWGLQPQRFDDTWLQSWGWSIGICVRCRIHWHLPKSDAYRIGAKHVTGISKARVYKLSFHVRKWQVMDVLCLWSSNEVGRFLGWCWCNWAAVTFPS
jgi:hypothetical protein